MISRQSWVMTKMCWNCLHYNMQFKEDIILMIDETMIIMGTYNEDIVLIPRNTMIPMVLPIWFIRLQFCVQLHVVCSSAEKLLFLHINATENYTKNCVNMFSIHLYIHTIKLVTYGGQNDVRWYNVQLTFSWNILLNRMIQMLRKYWMHGVIVGYLWKQTTKYMQ